MINTSIYTPSGVLTLLLGLFISQVSLALEGGQSANPSSYPGLVVISYDEIPNTFTKLKNCTGLVVGPRHVLTSTACVTTLRSSQPYGSLPIPAGNIHVHPVANGEIGGEFLLPVVRPTTNPRITVASYTTHPQSTSSGGPYDLAVIKLGGNINLEPAALYSGKNLFTGSVGVALGWKEVQRGIDNYYVLNKLSFLIVNGDTNILGLCYDNFTDTGSTFCGGLRNNTNYLESHDEGSPIFRTINGKRTVIGILSLATGGFQFEGEYKYEEYARVSSMVSYIKQNVPGAIFWNGADTPLTPRVNIAPILSLLLFD